MSNLREFTGLGHRSLTKLYAEVLYYVMEPQLNNSPNQKGLNPLFQQVLPSCIISRDTRSQTYKHRHD